MFSTIQKYMFLLLTGSLLMAASCNGTQSSEPQTKAEGPQEGNFGKVVSIAEVEAKNDYEGLSKATFASGCFWCTEAVFERVQGVEDVFSGYTGGEEENPTYEQVGAGKTSHAEGVMVYYDSSQVTFPQLVEYFFASHDPTQLNRQGPDIGEQYRSAAYYRNDEERQIIENKIEKLNASGKYQQPIVTQVEPFGSFYRAEDYHQDYYEHHPENPYIQRISRPKVEKFIKEYPQALKEAYRS